MTRHDSDAHHNSLHQGAWELLPWYVNGTLQGQERQAVEAHLFTCIICQAELSRLRELADVVRTSSDVAWSPSPARLSRLLARIDTAEARRTAVRGWLNSLQARWVRCRMLSQRTPPLVRWVLAAQAAVIVLLVSVMAWQAPFSRATFYQTLADVGDHTPQNRVQIRMVFAEDLTEKELRTLLNGLKGTIVAGPSSLGVYTVEVVLMGDSSDGVGPVLNAVRAHPKVRFAELTSAR